MRMFLALGLAAVFAMFALSGADAQQRRIYKYCLEEASNFGGWGTTLCRFNTIQQCRASMNSPWDRCVPNVYGRGP